MARVSAEARTRAGRQAPVLSRFAAKAEDALGMKTKAEKGKAHEFPLHEHQTTVHSHGHSHVVHYRKPGERDEWHHLTSTHEHEHSHAAVTHLHTPHEELGIEHVHEAHVHDHGHPAS